MEPGLTICEESHGTRERFVNGKQKTNNKEQETRNKEQGTRNVERNPMQRSPTRNLSNFIHRNSLWGGANVVKDGQNPLLKINSDLARAPNR
jgi:hypothetical protein